VQLPRDDDNGNPAGEINIKKVVQGWEIVASQSELATS
jgi:hypothetical protein